MRRIIKLNFIVELKGIYAVYSNVMIKALELFLEQEKHDTFSMENECYAIKLSHLIETLKIANRANHIDNLFSNTTVKNVLIDASENFKTVMNDIARLFDIERDQLLAMLNKSELF